jgi:hypothetical protein
MTKSQLLIWLGAGLHLASYIGSATASEPPDQTSTIDESLTVTGVSVPFMVRSRGGEQTITPPLTLGDLRIQVDGKPLSSTAVSDITLRQSNATVESPRRVTAVIDIGSLDARSRNEVANEIDRLAESAPAGASTYQFYGITNLAFRLNAGFTRSAVELRRIAAALRNTTDPQRGTRIPVLEVDRAQAHRILTAQHAMNLTNRAYGCHFELNNSVNAQKENEEGNINDRMRFYISYAELRLAAYANKYGEVDRRDETLKATDRAEAIGALTSLESVLRVRNALYAESPVLLFSSGSLDLPRDDRFVERSEALRRIADTGAEIVVVDVDATHRPEASRSNLLTALARESGGDYFTGASGAFRRMLLREQSRYLLEWTMSEAIPAERTLRVDIRVDSQRRPDLWGVVVEAPARRSLVGRAQESAERRLAALLSPSDFGQFGVWLDVGPPRSIGQRWVVPVRARVPLRGLTWTPTSEGYHESRTSLDFILTRQAGTSAPVCTVDGSTHQAQTLRLSDPPRENDPRALEFVMLCAIPELGAHSAVAVVRDEIGDRVGAARALTNLVPIEGEGWEAKLPRLISSSGRDFVWKSGTSRVGLDSAFQAGEPVIQEADGSNALRVEYMLCGAPAELARERVSHRVVRLLDDGSERIEQWIAPQSVIVEAIDHLSKSECAPVRFTIASHTLEPGRIRLESVVRGDDQYPAELRLLAHELVIR